MKIVIVDYGMGNIRSISSSLKYLGVDEVSLSADFENLKSADKLILPGVGSFGKAIDCIKQRELDEILRALVLGLKKPILGICLGMQLMGKSSTEDGNNEGLGFVNANVRKFEDRGFKIPHVGFNQVEVNRNSKLYKGIKELPDFYFTHSYCMTASDELTVSMCNYGRKFVASFELENIAGVQFHPELSQYNGLNLLRNFIENF